MILDFLPPFRPMHLFHVCLHCVGRLPWKQSCQHAALIETKSETAAHLHLFCMGAQKRESDQLGRVKLIVGRKSTRRTSSKTYAIAEHACLFRAER